MPDYSVPIFPMRIADRFLYAMKGHLPRWPALLGAILFSILLTAAAIRSSANNFGLIGYVASVYALQTDDAAKLHDLTYADLEQAIPHKEFTILTETPGYVAAVHNDPEALTVSFKHF